MCAFCELKKNNCVKSDVLMRNRRARTQPHPHPISPDHKLRQSGFEYGVVTSMTRRYYRGTSLMRSTPPVGPCRSLMPRDLW